MTARSSKLGTNLASAALIAFSLTFGSAARADENSFTAANLELDGESMRIELTARTNLGFPSTSVESGFVRVRFPDMTGWTHLDMEGDGQTVRFAHVRPGASNSAAVIIRLGDMRTVPERAVEVSVDRDHATISISREFLPGSPTVRVEASTPQAETAEVEAVESPAVAVAPVEVAAAEPIPVAPPANAAPVETPSAAPVATRPSPSATTSRPTLGTDTRSSSIPMLLGITVLLGAVLVGVRVMTKRRGITTKSPIRVMASHRLGPKQQLVVVRALGQDHFLSVDGAHTERLLSVPAAESDPVEDTAETLALLGLRAPAKSEPTLPRITGTRPVTAAQNDALPAGENVSRFGAHLLRVAADQTRKSRSAVTPSESVAGIVALRAKTGR